MSKKKAFGGSTMRLKDFHGGSIPADIPLPSAPGVIARPSDRPVYDRQASWGNRSEHRLRPSSSGSMRNLDDKTPFLTTNTANIGRNFDEDERKPLDGASGPRRTVSDESFGAPLARSEPGRETGGRFTGQQGLSSVVSQASASSYSARVVEGSHVGGSLRPLSGNGGTGGSYPNAWGVKKEAVVETGSSRWSVQNTVSKFAQASALDQISSGRWQTKAMHQQADVEVIRQSELPNGMYGRENHTYGGVNSGGEREYYEAAHQVRHLERGLANGIELPDSFHGGINAVSDVQRVHSPVLLDRKEKNSVLYVNEGQPAYPDGKYGGFGSHLNQEVSGRPRLKLLPRSKPLDPMEPSGVDCKQVLQQPTIGSTRLETGGNIHRNATHVKTLVGSCEGSYVKPQISSETENQPVERPKLNLNPQSQPFDQSVGSTQKERIELFGGARPREMVLKERGVDDINHEEVRSPIRTKSDVQCTETATVHANASRHSERAENLPIEHRVGRGHEKEPSAPAQKADTQKNNWRNENWRDSGEPEKHPQQERAPSLQMWRKPIDIEPAKPAYSDSSGLRFGKAVSASELVQAFSRSIPGPKTVDQFSGQTKLPGPGRSQIPFSRLTRSATRPRINGY